MNDHTERSLIKVDPGDLDIGPAALLRFRYRLPGEAGESESDRRLTASVHRCGVIQPPFVMGEPGDSRGALTVIDGHRRIAAARAALLASVQALLIPEGAITKREASVLWLEGAAAGEPLSQLERIILTRKASLFAGSSFDDLAPDLSRVIGREATAEHLERLWRILELDDHVLDALHSGRVSTGDLLALSEHAFVDASEAVLLLTAAHLTRSEQREAVKLMILLGDQGAGAWKSFTRSQRPGDTLLLDQLRTACYPSLTADRQRIDGIVRSLHLPPGTGIQPPENMEGGSYKLNAVVRDEKKLGELLEKLHEAIRSGKITALLDILKGNSGKDSHG